MLKLTSVDTPHVYSVIQFVLTTPNYSVSARQCITPKLLAPSAQNTLEMK